MDEKDRTQAMFESFYLKNGLKKTLEKAEGLLISTETRHDVDVQSKSNIKGELGEIVCFLELYELQKRLDFRTLLTKGNFIENSDTGQVTEIDLVFATPYQIYVIECKSYSGKNKVAKDKGALYRNNELIIDVFEQNRMHTLFFHKQYGMHTVKGSKPYTMILFDYATSKFVDKREEVYRKNFPILNQETLIPWIINDINSKESIKVRMNNLSRCIKMYSRSQGVLCEEHKRQLKY